MFIPVDSLPLRGISSSLFALATNIFITKDADHCWLVLNLGLSPLVECFQGKLGNELCKIGKITFQYNLELCHLSKCDVTKQAKEPIFGSFKLWSEEWLHKRDRQMAD